MANDLYDEIFIFMSNIMNVVLGSDELFIGDDDDFENAAGLLSKVTELTRTGAVNEAEDLLFNSIDPGFIGFLSVALEFFNNLNELSDDILKSYNYSRPEIKEGLEEIASLFDIDTDMFNELDEYID